MNGTHSNPLWERPAQELARALFQEAGDALIVVDPVSLRVLDVNPVALKLTDLPREALVGSDVTGLVQSDDQTGDCLSAIKHTKAFHSREGYRLRTARPGDWIPVAVTTSRLHFSSAPCLALLSLRDLRELHEAVRRSERTAAELKRVLVSVQDCVWNAAVGADGRWRYVYLSPLIESLTGRPVEHFIERPAAFRDLVHPADRPNYERFVAELEAGHSGRAEYRLCRADGSVRWVSERVNSTPIDRTSGAQLFGILSDVTERNRAEEDRKKFVALADASAEFIGMCDPDFKPFYVNPAGLRQVGLDDLAAAIRVRVQDFFFPEDQQYITNEFFPRVVREGGAETEIRFRHFRTGEAIWMLYNVFNLHDPGGALIGWATVSRNITERKRAEAELCRNEARYRRLVENAPYCIHELDATGRFESMNAAGLRMMGLDDPACVIGSHYLDAVSATDRERVGRLLESARSGETSSFEFTAVNDRAFSSNFVPLPGGKIMGITQDVTDRKHAAGALWEAHERLSALIKNSPLALVTIDAMGTVRTWNPAAEHLFGWTADEVVGRPIPTVPEGERLQFEHLSAGETTGAARTGLELRRLRKDGTLVDVALWSAPLHDATGAVVSVIGMFADISVRKRAEEERRKLEAQILHAQKLESLGVLAGGIAHDFNNLLTSVLGYSGLALALLPPESPAGPMLREIENASQRAADLTQQMLAYSGKGKFIIQVLRLDTLVREMAKLLATVVSKKATLRLDLAPSSIEGDATQIRQVVMNLITNASDALQDQNGVVRVETGVRHVRAGALPMPFASEPLPAGDYAFVEVEDSGCGMTAETRAKIFDPFFTTKFTGRGLGLAAVLGIIKGHGGAIVVESTPGRGTLFQVFLPHVGAAPGEVPARPMIAPARGQGTVLIVEDDASVRTLARRVLEGSGFCILEACDGRAGLDLFARHRTDIAAVLLDLTMPGLDGSEVLQNIRALDVDVPVVVMSGYSEHAVSSRLAVLGASDFLQKPFLSQDLVSRVLATLSTSAAHPS